MEEKENAMVYDYKTIKIKREMETITQDVYENLGWELTNTSSVEGSIFNVNLSFKRNRKIENKNELLKLQTKIDNCLATIENFQRKKKNAGFVPSLSTGIVGSLTFGGGMSLIMTVGGMAAMIGGIALGLAGIGICSVSYPIFKRINRKTNEKLIPMLDSEYDKLSDLCEEANKIRK